MASQAQAFEHRPVMLAEALEGLNIRPAGRYVDGTYGRGGHAGAIVEQLGETGRMLAIDKDPQAVRCAREQFTHDPRVTVVRGSFAMLEQLARDLGWTGKVDGVLFDLGVSSPQLDEAERGFGFSADGPLDMRMDPDSGVPASQWLNTAGEQELDEVLRTLGEERYHRRIARAIVRARAQAPIERTGQLAEIVSAAIPRREPHKHPATRTFQAVRIYINGELDELRAGLEQALRVLGPGGRLVVISFHSLEDRIVKRFIRDQSRGEVELPPDLPVRDVERRAPLRAVGKVRRASEQECAANWRARSAVMRVAERLS